MVFGRRRYSVRFPFSFQPRTITEILLMFSKISISQREVGKLIPSQLKLSACLRRATVRTLPLRATGNIARVTAHLKYCWSLSSLLSTSTMDEFLWKWTVTGTYRNKVLGKLHGEVSYPHERPTRSNGSHQLRKPLIQNIS